MSAATKLPPMLSVLREAPPIILGNGKRYRAVECLCSCGTVKVVAVSNLPRTTSCGCHRARVRAITGTDAHETPEYRVWANMKDRCENPNHKRYADWGGRGIKVCERWRSFPEFYADVGARPSSRHTIDRIDNNGNYEPGNVRWATPKEQARNRRLPRST